MSTQEFINQLAGEYDLEEYIIDDTIQKYVIDGYMDIYIEIDGEREAFNIYVEFTHPLYDFEEYEREGEVVVYQSTYFEAILRKKFLSNPQVIGSSYLGAPFDDERIGYFGVKYNIEFIEKFLNAYDEWLNTISDVDCEDLEENEIAKNLVDAKWTTLKNNLIDKGYLFENNILKRFDNSVLLTPLEFKDKLKIDFATFMKVNIIHEGSKFLLCKAGNQYVCTNQEIYNEVKNSLEIVECEYDIEFYTDLNRYLYFKNDWLCGLIITYDNINFARNLEFKFLSKSYKTYHSFMPPEMVKNISFFHLNDVSFENLAMDFLHREMYYDIHPLGKTNAADGGRDFLAKKNKFDVSIHENVEQWIIQCKFTRSDKKRYFNRSMISEIPDLLGENYANKYLLLTSGYLTPQIIDRIRYINRTKGNIIEFLAVDELKLALSKYPDLIKKYDLFLDN